MPCLRFSRRPPLLVIAPALLSALVLVPDTVNRYATAFLAPLPRPSHPSLLRVPLPGQAEYQTGLPVVHAGLLLSSISTTPNDGGKFKRQSWEETYEELCLFQKKNGHCLVGRRFPHLKKLSSWVLAQRQLYRKRTLSQERIVKLDDIGFEWDPNQAQWNQFFERLLAYQKEYGDCLVPARCNDKQLFLWVRNQRVFYKKGSLSKERISKLNGVDFAWDGTRDLRDFEHWDRMFGKLCVYYREHGNCLVPRAWRDRQLANWTRTQRAQKRKNKLTDDQIAKLDSIGFELDASANQVKDVEWNEMFVRMSAFAQEHGTCRVPRGWQDKSLFHWSNNQRNKNKRGTLREERRTKLNDIGFVWDIAEDWNTGLQALVSFKAREGHCMVPTNHKEGDTKLGSWVARIRWEYNAGKLTLSKVKQLEELGFIWKVHSTKG